MKDSTPFLKSDTITKKAKSAAHKPKPQVRSKFWKKFAITMAIVIFMLLIPTLVTILLAAFVDPLYAWLLIPALVPLLIAGILLVVSMLVAIRFLLTQHPTENEQILLGIFIILTILIIGFTLPSLSSL